MSDQASKPAVRLDIGDRFHVQDVYQVKNKKGQIITTYRPEFDYAVTGCNRELVERMIADGVAAKGSRPAGAKVTPAMRLAVRGRVVTGAAPDTKPSKEA
jgi:hypothetical protein